jgi:GT2 family glycosyltransferase
MGKIFTYPFISIIIVNLNGKDYLEVCLDSIKKLSYPQDRVEIIVVDNGSTDSSVDFINLNYPEIKVVKNSINMGFAYSNNQGVKVSKGEYVAFLNNDTRVDEDWLTELLRPIYGSKEIVCSGSKVLSMDGKTIDFGGSMINFEGKGFQIDYGAPVEKAKYNDYTFLPFVNGGAMLVNSEAFLGSGGFDEDFFAYYEDVDFGWRLWVLGYKVIFAPKSIVYHVHHGTSRIFSEDKLRFLKERNSLYSIFKNYDDENLSKVLSATLLSIFNRVFVDLKFDYKSYYDLRKINIDSFESQLEEKSAALKIEKEPLSSLMAVKNFFDDLPKLREKRNKVQSSRKRDDKVLFTFFKGEFLAVSPDVHYQKNQIDILNSLGIYEIFQKDIKRTLLIISSEVVSKEMAGPAIRVWNFAKVLSENINVVLAIPNETDLPEQVFKIVRYTDDKSLNEIIKDVDIVLCGGIIFAKYGIMRNPEKYLIIDIYDPCNLATLAEYEDDEIKRRLEIYESIHNMVNEQLYYGDFFICASDRQRDFWLGMLAALNRVNPYSYIQDKTMRKLIDVVPFGLPANKPFHTKNVLKGVVKGIGKEDFIILWGGGIYNWFDPLTLIKAMEKVGQVRGDIKLFFMGVKHPNPQVKELQLVNKTVDLSQKLNLYDKSVFFNFGWVEYDDRVNYLLESDIGIITHPEHIETRFSFRTRILDYLWASLPVISTKGDSLSELVERNGLGITVNNKDSDDLYNAILKLANDKEFYNRCVSNIEIIAEQYTWDKVCKPIIDFCKDPFYSAWSKERVSLKVLDNRIKNFNYDRSANEIDKINDKRKFNLIKKFFYHLFRSGPKKTFRYLSNYMKAR